MVGLMVLIVCVVISLIVGGLVFFQSPRSKVNQLFGLLTLAFSGLVVFNYFSLASDNAIFFIRLVILCTTLVVILLVSLFCTMTATEIKKRYIWLYWLISLIAIIIDLTPLGFVSAIRAVDGSITPVMDVGIVVFCVHFVVSVAVSFTILSRAKNRIDQKMMRKRYMFIQAGIIPAIFLAPVTGFILPVLAGSTQFIAFTPAYVVFFLAMVGYAIVRHGLFDVRLVAVRTVTYVLAILTMAGVYFGLAYFASVTFFGKNTNASISESLINVTIALVLAFIFQPIKQFFDHWTNKIFYRDSYDTHEFIMRLGQVLTSTTQLQSVLDRALKEIISTLKASNALFVVYRDNQEDVLVGLKKYGGFTDKEHDQLKLLSERNAYGVFVVDETDLPQTALAQEVYEMLVKRGVSFVLPLASNDEIVGYLLLGEPLGRRRYTRRDVAALEAIADALAIAVQNARSVQEVRDLNAHLEQRIGNATKELRESNRKLQKLDESKDEFISMASHQLRTPLTTVKGYISMLLDGDVGELTQQQRKVLEEAFSSSQRMVYLIGDFLNVSRLQNGKFELELREVDLTEIVAQEVRQMEDGAKSRRMTLDYTKPKDIPSMLLDENKIRQVIMNFIDNAVYYSNPGDRIQITLSQYNGHVSMKVVDHGIGVPPSERHRLFTKFYRASNAKKQRPDGTGIGLFMARKIVTAHGGSIIFETVEGRGSTFGFRLPIK